MSAEQFDEALVERLTAFVEARGFIAHWPHLTRPVETPLPVSPEKEYRPIYPLDIEALLFELSKSHVILPLAEYERLRTIAALALSQPTGLDYGSPRKDDKEVTSHE